MNIDDLNDEISYVVEDLADLEDYIKYKCDDLVNPFYKYEQIGLLQICEYLKELQEFIDIKVERLKQTIDKRIKNLKEKGNESK